MVTITKIWKDGMYWCAGYVEAPPSTARGESARLYYKISPGEERCHVEWHGGLIEFDKIIYLPTIQFKVATIDAFDHESGSSWLEPIIRIK